MLELLFVRVEVVLELLFVRAKVMFEFVSYGRKAERGIWLDFRLLLKLIADKEVPEFESADCFQKRYCFYRTSKGK